MGHGRAQREDAGLRDVVLLYRRSCPNVGEARSNLRRALAKAALPAAWREVDLDAESAPPEWRAFGSPTVLVDGVDVCGEAPAEGATCRVYGEGSRAPSIGAIAAAVSDAPARRA